VETHTSDEARVAGRRPAAERMGDMGADNVMVRNAMNSWKQVMGQE